MSNRRRNTTNFPRMKVRGKARRVTREIDGITNAIAALQAIGAGLSGAFGIITKAFSSFVESYQQIKQTFAANEAKQAEYALAAREAADE